MADLIQFDVASGVRIGQAIRWVEEQVPRAKPLAFAPLLEQKSGGGAVKLGQFTGAWPVGEENIVTLLPSTETVLATNLFFELRSRGTRKCAIFKNAGGWLLLQVQHTSRLALWDAKVDSSLAFEKHSLQVVDYLDEQTKRLPLTDCETPPEETPPE